jgi:hypothetical protein
MNGILYKWLYMKIDKISNTKKIVKIKLKDLNFIDYIKETILKVLNNP